MRLFTMVIFNISMMLFLFFWSMYKLHVEESLVKRTGYMLVTFSTSLIIFSHVLLPDSFLFYQNQIWQRLFFNFSFCVLCALDLYREWGTERFFQAFENSKKKLINLTR